MRLFLRDCAVRLCSRLCCEAGLSCEAQPRFEVEPSILHRCCNPLTQFKSPAVSRAAPPWRAVTVRWPQHTARSTQQHHQQHQPVCMASACVYSEPSHPGRHAISPPCIPAMNTPYLTRRLDIQLYPGRHCRSRVEGCGGFWRLLEAFGGLWTFVDVCGPRSRQWPWLKFAYRMTAHSNGQQHCST